MGEEQKKPAEKKAEEVKEPEKKKTEEKKVEEKKTEESKETSPPPPEEIVLRVYMHCEGCARKVLRCLRGFQGVEDVKADCKAHKVTVKGKDVDPLKVCERVQKKSHRKVELLSPIPKPPEPEAAAESNPEEPKLEQKKEEAEVMTVLLKVHMHCEACAFEIQKRIMRMKGVESADPDLKSSQVAVKGVFDPLNLVEYVWKRTGKHAAIVKTEAEKKEEEKGKEEKKAAKKEEKKEEVKTGEGEEKKTEVMMKNELYYYPAKYTTEYYAYPQIFSDENPNACSIM